VTGVQTCALPIYDGISREDLKNIETLFVLRGVDFNARELKVIKRPRLTNKAILSTSNTELVPWECLEW